MILFYRGRATAQPLQAVVVRRARNSTFYPFSFIAISNCILLSHINKHKYLHFSIRFVWMDRSQFTGQLESLLLDVHEIAALLGIAPTSVYSLMSRKSEGFPSPILEKRVGSRVSTRLWHREDVEKWSRTRRGRGRPSRGSTTHRVGRDGDVAPHQ